MGHLMKEALKCFCVEETIPSWCYAIFWKINCRNPMLLTWEEGHYEPTRCLGFSSMSALHKPEIFLKDQEADWNPPENYLFQAKAQTEDKIGKIFDQMIHQTHVRGQGIVGCVASMGRHRWLFRETYMGKGYSAQPIDFIADSQNPAGCQHQFSAGIQTIAVIPVLPDGVVELGSTQQIMENLEFVNHVQMLILQLKSVQGAFLPERTQKILGQKFQMHGSQRTTALAIQSRNPSAKAGTPLPLGGNSWERESLLIPQTLRFVSQPSTTFNTRMYKNMQTNASVVPVTSCPISTTTIKALGDIFQQNDLPLMKPNIQMRNQVENGARGAQLIVSNPHVQLNQQLPPDNPCSGSGDQLSVVGSGVFARGKTLLEQQVLSRVGFQGPLINNKISTNKTSITLPRPCGNTVARSHDARNISSYLSRNCKSTPCGTWKSVCPSIVGIGLPNSNLPPVAAFPVSKHLNNLNNVPLISGESQPSLSFIMNKHAGTEQATKQGQIENDLFQALDFRLAGSNEVEDHSWSRSIIDFVHDGSESSLNPPKGSQGSANSSCEENSNARAQCGLTIKNSHNCEAIANAKDNPLDALVPDFKIDPLHFNWDDLLVQEGENLTGSSTCISELDLVPGFEDSENGYFSKAKSDLLLDAVVSKFCVSSNQNSDDNLSSKTTLSKITSSSVDAGSTSFRSVVASEQKQGELFGLSQVPANVNITGPGCSIKSKDKTTEGTQTDGASKSQISLWVEDGQSIMHDSCSISQSKKADEPGKSNRKRPRPGDSSKPRPKDRQMIQDRVKELREIVPNGTKCSIDALLERTIKHMLFLQSVTKHADKLKQTSESKLICKEGGLPLKDNYDGGASWAFQVGSQSMVYPIIVEDLSHPRQMLVEMLCEEQGFFLEIADIIRGLGLTILKGVMEACNDKVWARFSVEANRDVTRFDVSLSLARLLERSAKGGLLPKVIRDSRNQTEQSTCHQAIHTTGLMEHLQ